MYRGPAYLSVADQLHAERMRRWARLDAALKEFFRRYNQGR